MSALGSGPVRRARLIAVLGALVFLARSASGSNPLEYPDNGSAAFARGGAWLAVGDEPIAAHYDPAALSIQSSGASLDVALAFPHTCFERRGPGDTVTGPSVVDAAFYQYRRVCNARGSFPNAIPSVSFAWRATSRLGLGLAIVPPSTYGTAQNQFPLVARGYDAQSGAPVVLPAPYRYLELEQASTILFPTLGAGFAVTRHVRIGAGFVWGIGLIDLSTAAVANLGASDAFGDHQTDDSLSHLVVRDLFVPGAVASVHASPFPELDVSVWGRVLDAIRASRGSLDVTQQVFDGDGHVNPPCTGAPSATGTSYAGCSANQSVKNHFDDAVTHFAYPIPAEVRAGVRFHLPRAAARAAFDRDDVVRDGLRDDVFDVELDASYAFNARASTIEVRFRQSEGKGTLVTAPTGVVVPPNADRATGYEDSAGVRLGGQWNVVPGGFALRAGGWFETRSQDPRLLTIAPVGAERFGFGGGAVVRYGRMDFSLGYQRHLSLGLDNDGNGRARAPAAAGSSGFDLGAEPRGVSAADRTQFRTQHAVNGGSVQFDAHVFTLGGTVRF